MSQNPAGYQLKSSDDIFEFSVFWNRLQQPEVTDRTFLRVALQRLAFASERQRNEDQMIDLLIAAEALFLNDVGNESDRGELTYRLSQRAGWFLGATPSERKEISLHMRKAYEVRSRIVHGAHDLRLPKGSEGKPVRLKDFAATTEAYVRRAFHKLISLTTNEHSGRGLVNWNELVFGLAITEGEVRKS